MAEIVLDHVVKRYPDGALAVDDFSLEIADGEFIILVGPSGCGKSTLLNMVAGLEDITQGELSIDGTVVNDKAPKDRDIAMVFQSYALYPHMTVGENMAFPLVLAGVDKGTIKSKVDEAAEMLELTAHLDRKPANLSGGQRQRVAMGRAIVRSPKAFLMDEPLSNLDAKLRVQMRTQVARIQKTLATTTLYVTHDQTEAMTLGDRVVVLRGGVVQQVGSPTDLYQHPTNLFVAGFIGSPAMNFLAATIEGDSLNCGLGKIAMPDRIRRAVDTRQGPRGHHRHPSRALRGRRARGRRPGCDGARCRSTSSSPWAPTSTPTSPSAARRTRATSTTWPRTWGRTCTARAPRSTPASTPRRTCVPASRPTSGSTPRRWRSSTPRPGTNLTAESAGAHAGQA